MKNLRGFVAYPSSPEIIPQTITAAKELFDKGKYDIELNTWEEKSEAGAFIGSNVREQINDSDFLIADVTFPSFNVIYEVGYAIGKSKRIILILNKSIENAGKYLDDVGLLDTVTYENYENAEDLIKIFAKVQERIPIYNGRDNINYQQPNFLLECYGRIEFYSRVVASIKQSGLYYRSFDPKEQQRLPPTEAIKLISTSIGVILPLLPKEIVDYENHSLRAAFLSGLGHGMGKEVLLLQYGNGPIPIDFRDFVIQTQALDKIFPIVQGFATKVFVALQTRTPIFKSSSDNFLEQLNIGSSAAENEYRDLGEYYIETHEFKRAFRGEGRIVAGRKGSGKSAIFWQIRDRVRSQPHNLVLDLKPDGYQLKKFKEQVLDFMAEGTREHTISAFWEYLIYLELCHAIFEVDKKVVGRNPVLSNKFLEMEKLYKSDDFIQVGDFSERLEKLLQQINMNYKSKFKDKLSLDRSQLTEVLYLHDVKKLKAKILDYLIEKKAVFILIDNLDKGWPPHGLEDSDILLVRALLESTRKIERDISSRGKAVCFSLVFIRNDVYELLVEKTSDRGKEGVIQIDWTDRALFHQLIHERLIFGNADPSKNLKEIWEEICIPKYFDIDTLEFLIERSLMRPRCLIDLIQHCISHAVNLHHNKIDGQDIVSGVHAYSMGLIKDLSLEVRDVYPESENVLYTFIASSRELTREECILKILDLDIDEEGAAKIIGYLLWYGFLGAKTKEKGDRYIYDCGYNMNLLNGLVNQIPENDIAFCINPAFWSGLEIEEGTV